MRTANPARIARAIRSGRRAPLALLLLALLAGCASLPGEQQAPPSQKDLAWVLSGADLIKSPAQRPTETLATVMHVTPAMRQFAHDAVVGQFDMTGRVLALAKALANPSGLDLQYDADSTLPADQSFQQRHVNCLSYSMLFVALARDVGIPAQFNEVEIPPVWDLGNDRIVMLYRHVNVRINLAYSLFQVVDVSGDEYDPSYDQHLISDDNLLAQYFNNRAAEFRLDGRDEDSLRYQLQAVRTAPRIDYLWANLAGLYLAMQKPQAARISITQAIMLDPTSMTDYGIAAAVYEKLGDHATASRFLAEARNFLDQNPYYHYQLALAALEGGNIDSAEDEIHEAIVLNPRDHRFYFLAAVIFKERGDMPTARDLLHRAIALTANVSQQHRYQNKFERIKQG